MKKPAIPCEINKNFTIPRHIREKLDMESYYLRISISELCDPAAHVNVIPIQILDQLDFEHAYLDIIQNLHLLSNWEDPEYGLKEEVKEYLRSVYRYRARQVFKKKFIRHAQSEINKNADYLQQLKIKAAKKKEHQKKPNFLQWILPAIPLNNTEVKCFQKNLIQLAQVTPGKSMKSMNQPKPIRVTLHSL